ncbi:MAG: hypothetical protein OHK0048_15750 [Rhodoferax sp.]
MCAADGPQAIDLALDDADLAHPATTVDTSDRNAALAQAQHAAQEVFIVWAAKLLTGIGDFDETGWLCAVEHVLVSLEKDGHTVQY